MTQFDPLVASFNKTRFTVFDTETTGLDPHLNRVIEIGAISFDSRGIISRFSVLIDPQTNISQEITRITGITNDMVAGKPVARQVLPDFLRFISGSTLIAHNASFDVNFINEELKRAQMGTLTNRVVDTLLFSREVFPGLPKYSLQELAVRFGIESREAHRAEDDSRVCMELFLLCLEGLKKKYPGLVKTETGDSAPEDTSKNEIQTTDREIDEELPEDDYEMDEDFIDEENQSS